MKKRKAGAFCKMLKRALRKTGIKTTTYRCMDVEIPSKKARLLEVVVRGYRK